MTIRDLRGRLRRLAAAAPADEVLEAADDQAFRDHALARLRHLCGKEPAPAPLPADIVRRLAKRAAQRPPIDEAALLERLRRLVEAPADAPNVRKGPLT